MAWIVIGEDKGKIKLVSKTHSRNELPGILPKGSFLTIDKTDTGSKFILRVDDSIQYEPYSPSPLIVDMDLSGLMGDIKCQNIIKAYRVKDINNRSDGKIDYIPPQSIARRSTQEEIDLALDSVNAGPRVFLATIHSGQNQILIDEKKNYITACLPEDMFFHQMQICGKTGSGKTVAIKYLIQYFIEKMNGAVLAVNVKDIDLLTMDKPSRAIDSQINNEWDHLNLTPHGIEDYSIYYPANTSLHSYKGITLEKTKSITLDVNKIDPDSLIGLLQNISEAGAMHFPDIFRFWQKQAEGKGNFFDFLEYFQTGSTNPTFKTLSTRGDLAEITLHKGTYGNIERNLHSALTFFDNTESKVLDYPDILSKGKLSVINVTGRNGTQFGSILLRHLLSRIVYAKTMKESEVPILVVIDEVHQFYNTESSKEALGDLDTICRTGRSLEIGVVFASQNQTDLPRDLTSVINTKIFFRSDSTFGNNFGILSEEIQSLKAGYAASSIHNLSKIKVVQFPLALCGVN
mgnify:CR=1 FL=1